MATTANHSALVPVQTSQEILANIYGQSALFQRANTQPMSGPIEEIVSVDQDALAAIVPDSAANVPELGQKPVIEGVDFQSTQMIARKMAAIVLVSDELKNDSIIDILAFYQSVIEQKFAYFIDYFGLRGGAWAGSEGILPTVTALGGSHVVTQTEAPFADTSDMLAAIEEEGRNPSGYIFDIRQKARFRNELDNNGRPLFAPSVAQGEPATVHGYPANFLGDNIFSASPDTLQGVAGDFSNYRIGVLEQITADLATTGTVPVNGTPVNLFTQNATALRVEMRLGAKMLDPKAFSILQASAPSGG